MAELTTVARPYAKAAFAYAKEHNQLSAWSNQLALAAALVKDGEFAAFLSRPSLTVAEQTAALFKACGEELLPEVRNFLAYVAQNKRVAALPAIAELYEILRADAERTADVTVTTAYALSPEQQQVLSGQLALRLSRRVSLQTVVDASLIGGVIIRTGDLVIDASVRGKLAKLSAALNS